MATPTPLATLSTGVYSCELEGTRDHFYSGQDRQTGHDPGLHQAGGPSGAPIYDEHTLIELKTDTCSSCEWKQARADRLVVRAGLDTMMVKGKGSHQFSKRTFHSLRYSFNSALANAGVSQEIRVKFTGHSSNAMNDRYTTLDRKPLGDAIEKLPMLDEG